MEGGAGGDGCVSFRREAHVPRGGPDGGDGGRGGDVVLVCDPSLRDLASLRRSAHHRAARGRHGEGKQRHGASGEEVVIHVAPGTQVQALEGGVTERLGDAPVDLVTPGQRVVAARGGAAGHGNKRFATSTRQAPRFAERGLPGESGWVELRLKLLADVGLVGMPNAGKSSLLSRITRAAPKVAGYPFTTTEPVLGTLDADDRQLVIADIPGLIEGAAGGAGLGHEFLAHVERCSMLVHLVDVAPPDGEPDAHYAAVREELRAYGAGLSDLPELVVLSKSDLLPDDDVEGGVAAWRERLGGSVVGVLAASAATGQGLEELERAVLAAHGRMEPAAATRLAAAAGEVEFAAEHRVYRPGGDEGYTVVSEGEGAFRVEGRGIELLVGRYDLSNEEALAYLEERLREIGVVKALESAGFEPGDELRVGEVAFDFYPGR